MFDVFFLAHKLEKHFIHELRKYGGTQFSLDSSDLYLIEDEINVNVKESILRTEKAMSCRCQGLFEIHCLTVGLKDG